MCSQNALGPWEAHLLALGVLEVLAIGLELVLLVL